MPVSVNAGKYPSRVQRLAVLDGYRAVAALLVVTTHVSFSTGFVLNLPLGAVFSRFDIGVAIFFLLSGFLLYRPWARAGLTGSTPPAIGTYLKHRFFRIMPAYWTVVMAVLLILPTAALTAGTAITNLTLTQFYIFGMQVEGLTQMWSVGVEVSFYLALPLIGWAVLRRFAGTPGSAKRQLVALGLMWIVGAGFTAFRTVGPLSGELGTGFWVIGFLDWFAVGMVTGLAYELLAQPNPPVWAQRMRSLANETTTCLVLAGALFIAAATPLAGPYLLIGDGFGDFIRHMLYPIIALLFLLPGFLASDREGILHSFLTSPAMIFLGKISYGIFLWHLLVRDLLAYYLNVPPFGGGFWWLLPLTIAITIGVAWASWLGIEEPLIRYSRRSKADTPAAPSPAPSGADSREPVGRNANTTQNTTANK